MNTDNNQNKQLTELSDEDLKNVTGGCPNLPEECNNDTFACKNPDICHNECSDEERRHY